MSYPDPRSKTAAIQALQNFCDSQGPGPETSQACSPAEILLHLAILLSKRDPRAPDDDSLRLNISHAKLESSMRLATHITVPSYSKDERLQRRLFSLAPNDVKINLRATMGESFSRLFFWELAFDAYLQRQYAAKDAAQPLRSWFAGSP